MTSKTISTARANKILGLVQSGQATFDLLRKLGIEPVSEDDNGFLVWLESDIQAAKSKMHTPEKNHAPEIKLDLSEILDGLEVIKKQNQEIFKRSAQPQSVDLTLTERELGLIISAITNQMDSALESYDKRLDSIEQIVIGFQGIAKDIKLKIGEIHQMQQSMAQSNNTVLKKMTDTIGVQLSRIENAIDDHGEKLVKSVNSVDARSANAVVHTLPVALEKELSGYKSQIQSLLDLMARFDFAEKGSPDAS